MVKTCIYVVINIIEKKETYIFVFFHLSGEFLFLLSLPFNVFAYSQEKKNPFMGHVYTICYFLR